ncbi:MAG: protein kinase [Deltaproteobacteria bacterium]|nr:protein kinase [Deltaproteobacteria bacterium]
MGATIGHGGMGMVFAGRDLRLARDVAIKILPRKYTLDEELVERFVREARAMAAITHPNIVPIHAVGTENGLHYFVMKLIHGATLASLVRARALDAASALPLFVQVCDALSAIHDAGYFHRDIKSSNIMVEPSGHATLLDFGVLRSAGGAPGLTQTGLVVGTPHYMAPEQARDMKLVDHRSDIYSFGVVMYEVLAGRLPFLASTTFDVMMKHNTDEAVPVNLANPLVPNLFAEVVTRSLAKRKEARFQSAADLKESLMNIAPKVGFTTSPRRIALPNIKAPTAPIHTPTALSETITPSSVGNGVGARPRTSPSVSGFYGESARTQATTVRRNRRRAWALAGIVALGGAAVAVVSMQSGPAPVAAPAPAPVAAPAPAPVAAPVTAPAPAPVTAPAPAPVAAPAPARPTARRRATKSRATATAPVPARTPASATIPAPAPVLARPAPAPATLTVSASHNGRAVFGEVSINGRSVGHDFVHVLARKRFRVSIKVPGFKSMTKVADLSEGDNSVTFKLSDDDKE